MEHSSSDAEAIADRYAAGTEVAVYFDPEQPTVSVLEPGCGGVNTRQSVGVVFTLFGVGLPSVLLIPSLVRSARAVRIPS